MSKKSIHFNVSERKILLRLFDIAVVFFVLYFVGKTFSFDYFVIDNDNWRWLFVLVLYISIFGTIFELYDLQKSSKLDKVWVSIVLTSSVTVLCYLLTPYFTPVLPENRLQILYFFAAISVAIFIWRFAYISFISSPRFHNRVLLVGEISNIKSILKTFQNADTNYKIIGYINCEVDKTLKLSFGKINEYSPKQIYEVIRDKNISEIVIASYDSENITPDLYRDLMALLEKGVPIKEYTQVYEELTQRVPVQYVGKDFYKYFPFSRSNQNKMYLFFHRSLDIFISVIGILLGVIVLPFVILGNCIANRGPLLYTQERIGKNGKPFNIIKYRTMITNAEKDGAVWAKKNDRRITPFGKFMRNTRMDEMPQFINILKGDMSFIGPRPERPHFVKELSQVLPFYETRHIVKPGLTGWAQVKARYGASVDESLLKLQYDLYYIKHRSFVLDINILVKTFSTIIYYRGQ
ncbi:exopolysaccharide biosynthesis polyprenyl glycosylphosphotransferase [Flavobacteriaceae bacterium MHTCC 0001]